VPPSKGFWKSNIQNSQGGSQKSEFAQAKTSGLSLSTYDYPFHFPPSKSKHPPPANCMPVEILGEIFTQFLQMGDFVTEPDAFNLSVSPDWVASPMVLGQVCGYWRSIALSMPSLWCSISVSSPVRGVVPRIQTWLERAGQHPLKIFVEQSVRPDVAEEAVTDEIFALLMQRYHHWEHITFKVYGRMIESLVNIPDTPSPFLTSALLDLWWNEAVVDRIWSVLNSSPKLSHVNWNDVYSHVRHLPTHIPWNQLEDVALSHYFDINEFCSFLEQCSRLERLQVNWIYRRHGFSPEPCAPILLTHLRHLSICARTSLDPVFNRFMMPALTSMSLNYDLPMKESRGASEFGDLLRRSSCTLKFFKIYDPEGVDFFDFLRHSHRQLNSLEDLHVRTTIPYEVTAALTLNSTNKFQWLPRLKKLKLAGCSSPEGIIKMISSRLPPHIKNLETEALTSAWVEINANDLPSELDAFRRVKRGGVQIELRCTGD